ncbi:MAG: YCF48-related protein [Chloroflexi bacterium]|nr:YCF48-related protein [Chloroflexota bacterium]
MTRTRAAIVAIVAIAAVLVGAGLVAWRLAIAPGPPIAWAHLGTEDVHSLAFEPGSTSTLLFGHHTGILRSVDGGRTWSPLPVEADAMGMRPAADGSIVIAGHEVLVASSDGGQTWASISSDLPNIDIHAFARDPADPTRMWAYLAEGGVYESVDAGSHWSKVYDGHIPFMTAVDGPTGTAILGIEPLSGFARSADAGRTWQALSQPESYPTLGLAATPDGRVVVLGTVDALLRSEDAGATWKTIPLPDSPFAVALSTDG